MLSKEYKYLVHTSRKLTVCSIGAPHLKPLSVAFTWPPEASRCNLCLFYIMNTNCLIKKALGSVVGDLTNSSKSKMSRSQREIRWHFCFKLLLIQTQGQIRKSIKNSNRIRNAQMESFTTLSKIKKCLSRLFRSFLLISRLQLPKKPAWQHL